MQLAIIAKLSILDTGRVLATPLYTKACAQNLKSCPLRADDCFLSFKKSSKRLSMLLDTSCHTLLKYFEISKKMLLTSAPSSKNLYTS